jgi:hypothetical protein
MQIETAHIASGVAIGAGATVLMDAWNLFLKRAFSIPSLNYCVLGRWVRHMPRTFRHASIGAAAPKPGECVVGGWRITDRGMASSKAARPAQARLKSLGTHTIYGIGLYIGGIILDAI